MNTPAIPNWLSEDIWSGIRFEEMVSCTRKWVKIIKEKEKPDLIIGLFHSGLKGGIETDEYDENATLAIAQRIHGLDVIFYGHDHQSNYGFIRQYEEKTDEFPFYFITKDGNASSPFSLSKTDSVLIVNPGSNAYNVGEATITLTMEGGKVVRTQASESDQPEENKEQGGRGNRNRGEAAQPVKTEDIVGQIANHMVENTVDFNEAVPVEQVARARQQEMVEIVRQITEQIRVNISSDVTSMELTLHPASLGNVQLTVLQDATGKLVAQFAVENETVRQAIEGQMSQLQQRLDEQGVKIEAVEVTLASHGFESSMNGQNTGQQADEQRDEQVRAAGPRGRRSINLDDLDPAEELEEEARIAAEMMAANGNTVDYTA
jgi:2',3'-cyclic-nucleotide 2'-phosphodiesterase (5'-nucleotidase family)